MKHFIADIHNGMESVIRYCNRPFSSNEEMISTIRSNWKKYVKPEDELYVLGDTYNPEVFRGLPGKLTIVLGNHDNEEALRQVRPDAFISPFPIMIDRGILISHQPIVDGIASQNTILNIHGHIHTDEVMKGKTWWEGNRWYNAGVDTNNFSPVPLWMIRNKLHLFDDCWRGEEKMTFQLTKASPSSSLSNKERVDIEFNRLRKKAANCIQIKRGDMSGTDISKLLKDVNTQVLSMIFRAKDTENGWVLDDDLPILNRIDMDRLKSLYGWVFDTCNEVVSKAKELESRAKGEPCIPVSSNHRGPEGVMAWPFFPPKTLRELLASLTTLPIENVSFTNGTIDWLADWAVNLGRMEKS